MFDRNHEKVPLLPPKYDQYQKIVTPSNLKVPYFQRSLPRQVDGETRQRLQARLPVAGREVVAQFVGVKMCQ